MEIGIYKLIGSRFDSPWKILGVKPGASLHECHQAMSSLLKDHRPESFPENPEIRSVAEENTKLIQSAYTRIEHLLKAGSENFSRFDWERRDSRASEIVYKKVGNKLGNLPVRVKVKKG